MTYKEELQENKEKILKDITKWSVDPLGNYYDAKQLSTKTFKSLTDFYFSGNIYESAGDSAIGLGDRFTDEDCEVKGAMVNEIESNPQDWGLEKEGEMLIVKNKSGRKHYKKGFSWGIVDDVWHRIEIALINQAQTREQLISEINLLEAENEEMKNNRILDTSERQEKLKKYQQRIEQLKNLLSFKVKDAQQLVNNGSSAPLLIGGIVLVGLVSFLVAKNIKKKKSKLTQLKDKEDKIKGF